MPTNAPSGQAESTQHDQKEVSWGMRKLFIAVTELLAGGAVVVGVLGAGAALAAMAAAPASAPTQASARLRTVYVAKSSATLPQTAFVRTRDCVRRPRSCVNGVGGLELVFLAKGKIPAGATSATVLTDTNCAADRNGISHCLNVLRLASGRRITVRHDHSMMNDPCLSPGERVHVKPLG